MSENASIRERQNDEIGVRRSRLNIDDDMMMLMFAIERCAVRLDASVCRTRAMFV